MAQISSIMFLHGGIEKFHVYEPMLEGFHNAQAGEIVVLKIASSGGNCDVAVPLMQAIQDTKAFVIADVLYPSYSMASLIALSCDAMRLRRHSFLMFHVWGGGGGHDKSSDDYACMMAVKKSLDNMMYESMQPFLTEKEATSIIEGKDFYIHWDDPTLQERNLRHFGI